MLTKGIVQEVISKDAVRVRLPLYNKIDGVNGSTPNRDLYIATLSVQPHVTQSPNVGDIVFVSDEDSDMSKLVILGYLSATAHKCNLPDMCCDDFSAKGVVKLSSTTTIGEVTPTNIECLRNLSVNLNDTLGIISNKLSKLTELEEKIAKLEKIVSDLTNGSV